MEARRLNILKHKKIFLDFDGVLFNSAVEAYNVCEKIDKNWKSLSLKTLTFEEFMEIRPTINDSGDFLPYYVDSGALSQVTSEDYKEEFYRIRKLMAKEDNYTLNYFPKYRFLDMLIPLILQYPQSFFILSTRDSSSISSVVRMLNQFKHLQREIYKEYVLKLMLCWGKIFVLLIVIVDTSLTTY